MVVGAPQGSRKLTNEVSAMTNLVHCHMQPPPPDLASLIVNRVYTRFNNYIK
jgi:hypothetical protein